MASGVLAQIFLKEQSRDVVQGAVRADYTPWVDPQKWLDTGARYIPVSQLVEPPVRKGRWDPATGSVIYEDGETEQSEIQRAAKQRKPHAGPTTISPQARRQSERERAPRTTWEDWATDPRRPEIVRRYTAGEAVRAIAKTVHTRDETVQRICKEAGVWVPNRRPTRQVVGAAKAKAKLSPQQVLEIRHSKDQTMVLAQRYGVDKLTIRRVRNGQTWSHIPDKPDTAAD